VETILYLPLLPVTDRVHLLICFDNNYFVLSRRKKLIWLIKS